MRTVSIIIVVNEWRDFIICCTIGFPLSTFLLSPVRKYLLFCMYSMNKYTDLNPASFKYLEVNARNNHCGRRLQCYNMDARYDTLFLLFTGYAKLVVLATAFCEHCFFHYEVC